VPDGVMFLAFGVIFVRLSLIFTSISKCYDQVYPPNFAIFSENGVI
jgi:hypothetical protein